MKKNFLLLLLLTLLPFAGWAANYNRVAMSPTSSSKAFTGADQALPTLALTYRNGGSTQTLPTSTYTVTWKYNGSEVTVANHAGEYTATIAPTSSADHFYSDNGYTTFSGTYTFTVTKINNTVSVPSFAEGDSWEYGQTPHIPASSALGGATVTFEISANGTSGWQSFSNLTASSAPNTWYVRAKAASTLDYDETTSANTQITITKAKVYVAPGNETSMWRDPSVWAAPTMDEINPTVTGGTTDWSQAKSYLKWNQIESIANAEASYEYTLESNGTSNDYYEFIVSGTGDISITKNNTGSVAGGGNANLVYDGTAQALNPATPCTYLDGDGFSAGTVQYKIIAPAASATDWSDEIPTATNADTYTIAFRGVGDQNHTDYEDPADTYEVLIDKATTPLPVITAVGGPFTYDAPDFDEDAFTVTKESDGALSYTYEFKAPGASTFAPATGFDGSAGTWKVYAHQAEGTNWYAMDDVTGFEFEVAKAENEFTTDPEEVADWQYDAATHDLLSELGAVNGGAKIHYHIIYTPFVGSGNYELDTDVMPTGEDAGTYQISYYADECDNYLAIAETDLAVVTVSKADLTVSGVAAKAGLVYNGSAQSILGHGADVETSYGAPLAASEYKVSYTGGETSPVNAYANVKQTNAGEYEVTCQVTPIDLNNFETPAVFGPVKAKIEKAPLDIAAQDIEVDWTGTAIDLPASHYAKGDPTDFVASETEDEQYAIVNSLVQLAWIGEAGNTAIPTDAGYYKFELALVGTDPTPCNYKINNFSPNASLQINKVNATAATVAAATLTYNGADQALLTVTGEVKGGTMLYFVGDAAPAVGDSKWETAVPKKTDADTYKVWYMTKGDNNHNDIAAAAVPVTIAPKKLADATFTIEPATSVYTGADQKSEIQAAIAVVPASTEPMDVDKDIKSITLPAEMKAKGDYNITIEGQGNYTGIVTKTYKIAQATNEFTTAAAAPEATALVYTGKELALVGTPAVAKFGEVLYSLDKTTWGEASTIKATDAAKYTIYYKVEGTADYTELNGSFTATITQAPNAVTVSLASWTYGDEAKTPVVTATFAGTDEPKIEYAKAVEEGETPVFGTYAEKVNGQAGSYIVKASVAETSNWAAAEKTATFTIAPKAVTPTEPELLVLTYNGKDQELVSAGSAEGTTIQYALDEGEFGDAIPTAKNAGTYTVHYQFAENSNYTYSKTTGDVKVKILQAHVTYRLLTEVEPYTGTAYEPVEGKTYELSDGGFFTGDENVFTFAFPAGFDATTACEEGREFDKLAYTFNTEAENYTVSFENKGLLVITKAALVAGSDFTAPAAVDLTFNGHSRKLVSAGGVSVVDEKPLGTILFSTTEDGTYTEAIPEGTNAGVYNVWYMVKGDANHSDTKPAKVADVKIKPYALTADMLKATAADLTKAYNGQVQSFNIPVKVKFAGDKNETVLEEAADGKKDFTVTINGKARKDIEVKNAGAYEFAFTGTNNYTGTVTTTAYITKLELIATAPNAVKTYDGTAVIEPEEFECTATQLKLYGGLEISGLLADDKIDLGDKTIADIIVPEGSAINVGEYNLKVNLAAIPVQANYTFNAQTFNGKLTINKAEAVKIGFTKQVTTVDPFWPTVDVDYKPYHKTYGTADPAFITEKGTNDVTSISGDLEALEGELFEDNAVVAALLGATRTAGEVYKKDGYTVKLGWKNTSNTAELAKIATFKNNYKNVTFGTTKLFIEPFAGTIKVSIKSMATTFDGNDHAGDCAWAADLSNMVVVGMPAGKNKNEIFTELPKITVTPKDGKVRNAGDYNITLSGGKSDNYDMKKVQFVLGSYLTVEPFEITPDMVTIPDQQVKIGDKAKDVIKHDAFTFAEGALPVAEDANLFQVVAAPDFIDANGKIKLGADPAEGLILARKDNTNAEALNYIGYDEVFGYLSIIGTPDLLVLDDTKDIATYDRENTDVTFTNRSIRQDDWNVLCLPFDATIKEISDAFGYAAVDLLKKESVDGSMHFVVTTSGTVPAGEPFIIKPTSDPELNAKSNFVQVKFTGVTVKEFSDNPEPVKDSAGNKFCGTFKAQTTFFGEKFWYMSKSEWKQASNFTEANPQKLGAYRAYIETATAGARIFIEEPDGTITAINAIDLNNNTMDEGWYTVNGMKLNAAPTQKGTYIKDGKKVFVK